MFNNGSALAFSGSNINTVGMEIEYQLIDPVSLDLTEGILPLMQRYPDSLYVKPEFIQNTVEVASPVCHSIKELDRNLRLLVKDLLTNCKDLGIAVCGAGTHPFCQRLAEITPMQRYLDMEKSEIYNSHTQITFATHVHIGMRSGDEAIAVMQEMKRYLPLLIALSASSPFWRGNDTGYESFRYYILAASRSYGEPPYFRDWQDFCDFFTGAQRAGIFETVHDIHWDMRPRPHLGTLEMRVMDAQTTVSDAVALAALIQALVVYIRSKKLPLTQCLPNALQQWINRNNYYKAAHYGKKATYFDDSRNMSIPILQFYDELNSHIIPFVGELNTRAYLAQLTNLVVSGGGADLQRGLYEKTDSLKQVVSALVADLETDIEGN